MQQIAHDVVILGTGLAGLRAAVEICIRTRVRRISPSCRKCR